MTSGWPAPHVWSRPVRADELAVASEHAAEVLRPRALLSATHDDVSDLALPKLLNLLGERLIRVELSLREELHRFGLRLRDERVVLVRVQTHIEQKTDDN